MLGIKITSPWFFRMLLAIMLIAIGGDVVKGQTSKIYAQYIGPPPANTGTSPASGGSASVVAPTNINLYPTDATQFAELKITSGSGLLGNPSSAFINLKFSGTLPITGAPIMIKVEAPDLSKVQVQALDATGAIIGSSQAISTLNQSSSPNEFAFYAPTSCAGLRITSTTAGGTLLGSSTNNTKIYAAYFLDTNCNIPTYTTTKITSILDLGSTFTDPANAIDENRTTFSKLAAGLGLGTTLYQNVYLSKPATAQDAATIVISIPPSALAVGVASNINITAYNGTTQVGQISFGGLLLGTDLLTLINSGQPAAVSFSPGAVFNRIEISLTSLLALATSLNIYEVEVTPKEPTFPSLSAQNVSICQGNSVTLTPTPPGAGNELRWYTTPAGGSPVYVGNSYTPTPNLTATTTYYIAAAKIGCIAESERAEAKVTVNPLPVVNPITGSTNVCVGKKTQLNTTTTGGTWSSNNGNVTISSTGEVTGVTAGTSIIIYSTAPDANGCVGTASVAVTINPLPSVAAITGNTNVCIGKITQLTTTTTGGTWSSNNSNASVSSTGLVTGLLAGTSIITYTTAPNANGCVNTTSVTVTVNPLPSVAAITGPTAVCVGQTITLSNTTTGGSWSTNNGNVTVSASGVVTGVTAGSSIITYSTAANANGCINTTSVTVTVNPIPAVAAITGNTSVCVGQQTTLNTTTTGGTWSSNNGNATVNASGVVTGVTAGTSIITYTTAPNANGCINTTSITVTINALPAVPFATLTAMNVCVGSTANMSVSFPIAGITYKWYTVSTGGTPEATGTTYSPVINADKIYYIEASNDLTNCVSQLRSAVYITAKQLPTATITGTVTVCQNSASPNITLTGSLGEAPYIFVYQINGGSAITVKTTAGNTSVTVPVATNLATTLTYTLVSVQSETTNCKQLINQTAVVTVKPLPTITLGSNPNMCQGISSVLLPYTSTTGTPTSYTISWNAAATTAGFQSSNGTLSSTSGNLSLSIPTTISATTYKGFISVKTADNCEAPPIPFDLIVHPKPTTIHIVTQ